MTTLNRIQTYLQASQLDGWLLYDFRGSNPIALHVAGLTTSGTRRWFLWIPAEGNPVYLIHAIESSTFVDVAPGMQGEIRHYVGWQELAQMLPTLIGLSDDAQQRIAMEYSPNCAIPYVSRIDAGTKELVEQSTGAEIVSSADLVQLIQAVLTPEQIASHRRAAEHCVAIKDAAFDFIRQQLQAGTPLTEYDVQQFILQKFDEAGLETDHPPEVSVNDFAADPHYAPSATRHNAIQEGDMVLIDLWARETNSPDDCYADITWTAYCGTELPETLQRIGEIVRLARDAAVAAIQERLDAGQPVYGYEIDDVAREVIDDAGYGEYFIHRTGHSLGTSIHFNGANIDNLETQDRRQLIPGILFTIEPGIYMPDFVFDERAGVVKRGLGIRSEINCLMHEDRVEVTTLPLQTELVALLA
ncbi:MAG: M24 family metallopeptidase [Chloroflexota bacterium]